MLYVFTFIGGVQIFCCVLILIYGLRYFFVMLSWFVSSIRAAAENDVCDMLLDCLPSFAAGGMHTYYYFEMVRANMGLC